MYVWRVADDEGQGPFFSSALHAMPEKVKEWRGRDPYRHPNPTQEGLVLDPHYHCGCVTLAQVKLWFTKAQREWLAKRGFKLKRYRIDPKYVSQGRFQCTFKRSRGQLVSVRDLQSIR